MSAEKETTALAEEHDDRVIGRAFLWSLIVIGVVGLSIAAAIVWYRNYRAKQQPPPVSRGPVTPPQRRDAVSVEVPQVKFVDVTEASGITFTHFNGAQGEKLLPETMGSGVAAFDFDNDGDQDLLFINGTSWPWTPGGAQPTQALYENDGRGMFQDVTAGSGLDVAMYGMGAACGDYDGDGLVDVFITAVGDNRLFKNLGGGKFQDVTEQAGLPLNRREWSTSAAFFDFDRDGDLDLFVANYVRWSREKDLQQPFTLQGLDRAYGPPTVFDGTYPSLYANDGAGRFTDISAAAGIQVKNPDTDQPMAKSMGVAILDFNEDGWPDVAVANDTVRNFLFQNLQNGRFLETGHPRGIAYDSKGSERGAMGIDVGDLRNNGDFAIAIGNFANEPSALYVGRKHAGQVNFTDQATSTGFGPQTRLELTFGIFFFDYDLDGRLDLLSVNGHLENEINKVISSQTYAQKPHLFWNAGMEQGTELVSVPEEKCGADLCRPLVGRGSAYADFDGDGDLDVVMTASNGPARLLRNDQELGHHWLRIRLAGRGRNRHALGATVSVTAGGVTQRRFVTASRSYCSQCELPVTFGLGQAAAVDKITVTWPDGRVQQVPPEGVDRTMTVADPG